MAKRAIALILVSGVLAAACGCNVCRAIIYDPFGPNTLCDSRRCGTCAGPVIRGPACEGDCGPGPIRASCPCPGPCDGCCDDCGGPTCRHHCGLLRGPLCLVFGLFNAGCYRDCGPCGRCSGCGERYWGDWYGDPPECCDPCDAWGSFTGGGCSSCGGHGGAVAAPPDSAYAPGPGPSDEIGMVPQAGGARTASQPAGCRNCGQSGYAARSYPGWRPPAQYSSASPYAAGRYAPTQRAPNGSSAYASGRYAPRVLSTTDRVVKPATAGEQTPHLAQPQRADVRQE